MPRSAVAGLFRIAKLFFTVIFYFTLLPIMYESSSCSASSPIFGIVIFLNLSHSSKYVMVFLMALICIYLITKDVLIGHHISSLLKYLFKSLCVFVCVFIEECYLFIGCRSSLYILDRLPLSNICIANIFSQLVAFHFIYLTGIF